MSLWSSRNRRHHACPIQLPTTDSPQITTIHLMSVQSYDSAGKSDLQPVHALMTVTESLWLHDQTLGT